MGGPGFSSPGPRAKTYRNVSSREADGPYVGERVEVRDPRHPLFGRRFVVLRRLARRSGNVPPSFEVAYRDGATLLIPEAACTVTSEDESNLKLSVEGLREMVSLLEAPDEHADRSRGAVGDAAAGPAPAHRGGARRGSGTGDAP